MAAPDDKSLLSDYAKMYKLDILYGTQVLSPMLSTTIKTLTYSEGEPRSSYSGKEVTLVIKDEFVFPTTEADEDLWLSNLGKKTKKTLAQVQSNIVSKLDAEMKDALEGRRTKQRKKFYKEQETGIF